MARSHWLRPYGLCRRHVFRSVRSRPHDTPLRLRVLAAFSGGAADRALADFSGHAASFRRSNTIAFAILLIVAVLRSSPSRSTGAHCWCRPDLYRHRDCVCIGDPARFRSASFLTLLFLAHSSLRLARLAAVAKAPSHSYLHSSPAAAASRDATLARTDGWQSRCLVTRRQFGRRLAEPEWGNSCVAAASLLQLRSAAGRDARRRPGRARSTSSSASRT